MPFAVVYDLKLGVHHDHSNRAGNQVLRVLAITRLIEVFSVHACVEDAAGSAGHSGLAPAPAAGRPVVLAAT
jgi:hypothetical protein